MKRFALSALILIVILFTAVPTFAQDSTPEVTQVTTEAAASTEAEPEGVQGASLAVILIGAGAVFGVLGYVLLHDGKLGGKQ